MRLALLALGVVAALILWRRRGTGTSHVVVAWRDGAEVALREGDPKHERIASVAERTLA